MYISTCHAMHVEILTLQDESIHLVGTCLLAGFLRVIGTLWQVNDKRSRNLSKDFYSKLVDKALKALKGLVKEVIVQQVLERVSQEGSLSLQYNEEKHHGCSDRNFATTGPIAKVLIERRV